MIMFVIHFKLKIVFLMYLTRNKNFNNTCRIMINYDDNNNNESFKFCNTYNINTKYFLRKKINNILLSKKCFH